MKRDILAMAGWRLARQVLGRFNSGRAVALDLQQGAATGPQKESAASAEWSGAQRRVARQRPGARLPR